MTGSMLKAGYCLLCALLLCAIAAQPAAAVTPGGSTAFTCKKKAEPGGVGFSKAHCKAEDAVGTGAEYEHVEIPTRTPTALEVSSKDTAGSNQPTKLKSTISGINVELRASEVSGTGSLENSLSPTGEHSAHGSLVLTYNKVSVTAPAEEKCKVKGEKVVTKSLTVTTSGQEGGVLLKPTEGTLLASFELEGCTAAINGSYEVKGSISCPVNGATVNCTHSATTALGTLTMRGQKVGIEGSLTAQGKDTALGDPSFTPLSTTAAPSLVPGTTAFTCKKKESPGGAGFSKSHCKAEDAVEAEAAYEQVPIAEETKTEVTGTNKDTAGENQITKLKSTISGVALELQASEVVGTGWMENFTNTLGEHFVHGEGVIHYSGVKVTAPAGKGCKVKGEELTTNVLRGYSAGQGMAGRVEPAEGEAFLTLTIEGCSVAGLNNSYEVKGSVTCPIDGATITCTEKATTEQNTIKMAGQKVGIEGGSTGSGRAEGESTFTPLSEATVETP
jgi:hypothetical protein